MTIRIKTGTVVKAASSIRMMVAPAISKRVRRIRRVETGNVLQAIFTGFEAVAVSIEPSPLYAFSFNNSIVSGVATATVTGGVAPFAYSWTVITSSGAIPAIIGAATASPTFRQTGVASETFETAVIRASITDASGQSITTDLFAEFYNQSFN